MSARRGSFGGCSVVSPGVAWSGEDVEEGLSADYRLRIELYSTRPKSLNTDRLWATNQGVHRMIRGDAIGPQL
eukprot:7484561-Pyramimonas_sp.AAC.5